MNTYRIVSKNLNFDNVGISHVIEGGLSLDDAYDFLEYLFYNSHKQCTYLKTDDEFIFEYLRAFIYECCPTTISAAEFYGLTKKRWKRYFDLIRRKHEMFEGPGYYQPGCYGGRLFERGDLSYSHGSNIYYIEVE